MNLNSTMENINTEKCPIRFTINMIGGKWKLLILWELHENKILRFNQLKKQVYGITNTMLSKSLEELESHHLINRKQYNQMPLRVEYTLTSKGDSLIPILTKLAKWGTEYI